MKLPLHIFYRLLDESGVANNLGHYDFIQEEDDKPYRLQTAITSNQELKKFVELIENHYETITSNS